MNKLIGISGYARSGKDTVGQYLVERYGYQRVAFADAVRHAVLLLDPMVKCEFGYVRLGHIVQSDGWDAAKVNYDEIRRLLQVMGTEVGRMLLGENVWIEIAGRKMEGLDRVVITDVRFENEAAAIREWGGQVWRINRPGVGAVNGHASEALAFDSDVIVENDGALSDLFSTVDSLLDLDA